MTRRTTSRRTTDLEPRFLASAGSSICSQTATLKPCADQAWRGRPRRACTGTPHIGMSSPRCLPRLVSAMPSAARRPRRPRRTARRSRPCGRTAARRVGAPWSRRYCAITGVAPSRTDACRPLSAASCASSSTTCLTSKKLLAAEWPPNSGIMQWLAKGREAAQATSVRRCSRPPSHEAGKGLFPALASSRVRRLRPISRRLKEISHRPSVKTRARRATPHQLRARGVAPCRRLVPRPLRRDPCAVHRDRRESRCRHGSRARAAAG